MADEHSIAKPTDIKFDKADKDAKAEERPARRRAGNRTAPRPPLSESELVDEASEESFPASDPPSFMGRSSPGRPRR